MSLLVRIMGFGLVGVCLVVGFIGCGSQSDEEPLILKVGVITSIEGPATIWGEVTVLCAKVTADYYNNQGGVEIEGKRVPIELMVRDDGFDPVVAEAAADELIEWGARYVIGPLGDETVSSAARVLDAADVMFLHYGFSHNFKSARSLGILGMPKPEQSLPWILNYLQEEKSVSSILVLGNASSVGIQQKVLAEKFADLAGMEVLRLSRYDISEECFDLSANETQIENRVLSVVQAQPGAVILAGFPPSSFLKVVDRLRYGGYNGIICAANYQDADRLLKLGPSGNGVLFVGGAASGSGRSAFYEDLRERYLEAGQEWSVEAETKLYAMEFILACIRSSGLVSLENTSIMHQTLQTIRFEDPFREDAQILRVLGASSDAGSLQLETTIRISEIVDGELKLVREAMIGVE